MLRQFERTLLIVFFHLALVLAVASPCISQTVVADDDAIVAATKNGAIACKGIHDFGTLEAGKFADMLILSANPLSDISNLRKLDMVMKEGQFVDLSALPTVSPYREWGISR